MLTVIEMRDPSGEKGMMLEISIDGMEPVSAEISNTGSKTIEGLKKSLPLRSTVNRWGSEIYFYVDFKTPLEDGARSEMKVGEIAYWPNGPALAIFFGPTPASSDERPVAASDCNVIGMVKASPELLGRARDGAAIKLRQI